MGVLVLMWLVEVNVLKVVQMLAALLRVIPHVQFNVIPNVLEHVLQPRVKVVAMVVAAVGALELV